MKPTSTGYADVNGIRLYHEIHGQGEPLVLIHGGLTTIGEMRGWVRPLARTRRVVARDAGPRPHGRHRPADELRDDGRRPRGAAGLSRDPEGRPGGPFLRRRLRDP